MYKTCNIPTPKNTLVLEGIIWDFFFKDNLINLKKQSRSTMKEYKKDRL